MSLPPAKSPRKLATVLILFAPLALAQDLLIRNAKIVDPVNQVIIQGSLLIVDGRIAGNNTVDTFDGHTLDVGGKWVIPGLNDLHTHSYGNMAPGNTFDSPGTAIVARRLLFAGVTGFLDLFGSEDRLYALREQQKIGTVDGATLFTSLSCLTATDGHCTEYGVATRVMNTPGEAVLVVNDLAGRRPDVVKIVYAPTGRMPSIDQQTLAAAISTARDKGIKTVIHINTWRDVRDAVAAGASAVTHVPRGPIPDDLAGLMFTANVASIPTLAVETELADYLFDPAVLDQPLAKALTTPEIIEAYRSVQILDRFADQREYWRQRNAQTLASVKAMADAGVTIITGSDAGNWGTIHGYSVHRELVKMVAAGLTPWQALAASTSNAGEFLGRSYGVQPGDEANLVVLDASPIADIRNTQRIAMVIHRGRVIDRERMLTPALARSN